MAVVLHGLGRTRHSMGSLVRALEREGYAVVAVGYPSRSMSLPELVRHLGGELTAAGLAADDPGPVHFVGHSAGGILARAFLEEHPDFPVGRVVQLAPPNTGSALARSLAGCRWFEGTLGPLARTFAQGAERGAVPPPPPSYPLGVIAGDRSLYPTSLWIPGEDDGVVGVDETRAPGMTEHLVVPRTHTFIMNAQPVQAQVVHFLRTGSFLRGQAGASTQGT